jgi:RNA polymerase sigma-70 factor (ECF subfamily)
MGNGAGNAAVRATVPGRNGMTADGLVRAFDEVRAELVSTLYYWLGNHDDAQDAAQETFLKCWRARATLGEVRNLRAWIFRVGLNAAKDLQRSAWQRHVRPLDGSALPCPRCAPSPADTLAEREDLERLRAALMELRPEEKEVFLLRQNGSLTYEEIAELRRTPVGTVKTQMRAALQKLRMVLHEPEPLELPRP